MLKEYIIQLATKIELSTDTNTRWTNDDIIHLMIASLRKFSSEESGDMTNTIITDKIDILHEILKQHPPTVVKTKTTSYLFLNSTRYHFYYGMINDDNTPLRYDVFTCAYDSDEILGKYSLRHNMTTEDGELKVSGILNFCKKPNKSPSNAPKIKIPDSIISRLGKTKVFSKQIPTVTDEGAPQEGNTASPVSKKARKILSPNIRQKSKRIANGRKTSGLNNMLKYLAPGTAGLFQTRAADMQEDDDKETEEEMEADDGEQDFSNP